MVSTKNKIVIVQRGLLSFLYFLSLGATIYMVGVLITLWCGGWSLGQSVGQCGGWSIKKSLKYVTRLVLLRGFLRIEILVMSV